LGVSLFSWLHLVDRPSFGFDKSKIPRETP
jgi:hypothetical protein